MNNVRYFGCFFEEKDLKKGEAYETKPLYRSITVPHITLIYRPTDFPKDLIGSKVSVLAVGYGNNGENEALLVEFLDIPQMLEPITCKIAKPHITLSVSKEGKSVNSKDLEFEKIPKPFVIHGVIGVMDEERNVHI